MTKGLNKRFWAEAVETAAYLHNRLETRAIPGAVPEAIWTGKPVDVSHLRVFGSEAYALIPKEKRNNKFDPKSQRYVMVGYCKDTKGYRLVCPSNPRKIVKAKHVRFIEEEEPVTPPQGQDQDTTTLDSTDLEEPTEEVDPDAYLADFDWLQNDVPDPDAQVNPATVDNVTSFGSRYPTRERRKVRDPDFVYLCHAYFAAGNEPLTVEEAVEGQESDEWQKAMIEELESLKENSAWVLVDRPANRNVVQSKWVFKVKCASDGTPQRYKARLVARGFSQQPGIDFHETFAPVARHSTLRLLFAIAAERDLSHFHWDIQTAFLYGDLKETIYMEPPKGMSTGNKVCLLKKSLYGLKQSPRSWNQKIDNFLKSCNFKNSRYDPCLYINSSNGKQTYILLFVDDLFVFSNDRQETTRVYERLERKFKVRNLGEIQDCLGVRVKRENGVISLDQEGYIDQLLERYDLSKCNPAMTPLNPKEKLQPAEEKSNFPYQRLIGSLMYLSVFTRPDIAFAVSYLSQFNNSHSTSHWVQAKRVLRYLKGTKKLCLSYRKGQRVLLGYTDADWGGDHTDRRSFTGYLFTLGQSAVSWEARKQRTVALSSTEAEYMALCESAREALFLRGIYNELQPQDKRPSLTIYNDSQSAQSLCHNPVYHKRSKHIDIKYHFVRDCVNRGTISIKYLSTHDMPADALTKSIGSTKLDKCKTIMGLLNP